MQLGTEIVIFSSVSIVIISAIVGTYFLRIWFKQSARLITDLPLVFAIMTISQAFQNVIVALQNLGIIDDSLMFFKLRSLIIAGSIIPLFGAVLQIWLPRIQRYHTRILIGLSAYWGVAAIFGASSAFIMTLTIPLILISGIMMMVTFIITWKTGRLKEIRSSVIVLSIPFAMASQVLRVPLLGTPLFYLPDILLVATLFVMPFAFIRVRQKKEPARVESVDPPRQIEVAAEF
ncbi:MAG: hypothetical protein ACTSWA_08680 [Candidatus Thorarchaeota archaeon]